MVLEVSVHGFLAPMQKLYGRGEESCSPPGDWNQRTSGELESEVLGPDRDLKIGLPWPTQKYPKVYFIDLLSVSQTNKVDN